MKKISYKVLGIMSGTSLDGVDIALINFKADRKWTFKVSKTETKTYSPHWKKKLAAAVVLSPEELIKLDVEYTSYLGAIITQFLKRHKISDLDAVCSHGHTIKHEPQNNYTLQIGNLPALAEIVGHKIVCDFRVQDVKLGGQGAPLVPIGDKLLFPDFKFCLNLGGFANISVKEGDRISAWDVCAVNTVLNLYAEKLGYEYDRDGQIAASGKIESELMKKLEDLDFYRKGAPKSLGIEWVNAEVLPLLRQYEKNIPNLMSTYTRHIAMRIAESFNNDPEHKVLATGGGSLNKYLISQIKQHTTTEIILPSAQIINYKEAIIFGFLGVLKLREEINVLSSVTGALNDHSSGTIYDI